jgi:FkbM family methyltransferase
MTKRMQLRTKIIQKVIDINEKLIFYPKLKKFYTSRIGGKDLHIIDVGSNKGQSIDFFKQINKEAKIFGFEPNKKLFNRLLSKYAADAGVKVSNMGISSSEGKLVFHENVLDETSTFEELNFESEYLKKKASVLGVSTENIIADSYEVEVTTLSHFLKGQGSTFFDVLKIDVEGHELQALQGLFLNGKGGSEKWPVRFIQIESHNDDMYLKAGKQEEITMLLEKNGFAEVAKIKHGFGDFHEIVYGNTNL